MASEYYSAPEMNSIPKGLIADFEKLRDNFDRILECGIEDFLPNSKFFQNPTERMQIS